MIGIRVRFGKEDFCETEVFDCRSLGSDACELGGGICGLLREPVEGKKGRETLFVGICGLCSRYSL